MKTTVKVTAAVKSRMPKKDEKGEVVLNENKSPVFIDVVNVHANGNGTTVNKLNVPAEEGIKVGDELIIEITKA